MHARARFVRLAVLLLAVAVAGLAAPAGSLARTSGAKPFIQGGETPAEGTYGYVGHLAIQSPEGEETCSSSLIAPQWVLTAGHCVGPVTGGTVYAASAFKVTLGSVNWKKGTADGVSEVFRNPGYKLYWKPGVLVRDDSGLLRLGTPSSVAPITLITPARFASEIKDGTLVSAAGWGLTAPTGNEPPETLKVVHGLKVLEEDEAESEGNKVLIGSEAAKGTCEGDSGGPFIDSRGEEIASTSAGPSNACNETEAQSIPAVYGWIRETIGPDVTSSPASTDAAVGHSATFTVACTGKPAPTVQWQLSTNDGTSFENIEAATGPTYVTPTTTLAMNGYEYRAVCSGSLGEETSAAATLTVFATCTTNSGTITLSPGLTSTPAVQTLKVKGTLSGCTGDAFTETKYTATLKTAAAVSCPVLKAPGETATGAAKYEWVPKAKASTGSLNMLLAQTPEVAFSSEVSGGSYSPLRFSGTVTESYTGGATCGEKVGKKAAKVVKKGTFSGSAVDFE